MAVVKTKEHVADSANLDPITGEPGAHPVGTGVGTAGGAALGGAIGSVAGPVGTVVGAVVGGVAGGLMGKGVAESIDPTVIDSHWSTEYASRPYVTTGETYDAYRPAYHYGANARTRFGDRPFDEVEDELSLDWAGARGESQLAWDRARHAARDAYDHSTRLQERAHQKV